MWISYTPSSSLRATERLHTRLSPAAGRPRGRRPGRDPWDTAARRTSSVQVVVTDDARGRAAGTFNLVIKPPQLAILTREGAGRTRDLIPLPSSSGRLVTSHIRHRLAGCGYFHQVIAFALPLPQEIISSPFRPTPPAKRLARIHIRHQASSAGNHNCNVGQRCRLLFHLERPWLPLAERRRMLTGLRDGVTLDSGTLAPSRVLLPRTAHSPFPCR